MTNGIDPISSIVLLGSLGLLPIALVATTSFIKFVVTLGILRSAIGTPQIPPTIIITTLSVLLTAFVMAPVATKVYAKLEHLPRGKVGRLISSKSTSQLLRAAKIGYEPLESFLLKNTLESDIEFFLKLQPEKNTPNAHVTKIPDIPAVKKSTDMTIKTQDKVRATKKQIDKHSNEQASAEPTEQYMKSNPDPKPTPTPGKKHIPVLTLIAAFVIGQLSAAFKIGFMLFIPFLVIDLVVSNVLLSLGMHMLSPTTISLPFKILLFVLVDGWHIIVRGLVMSYGV